MESLGKIYKVEMVEEERIDGQLVYRICLPLHDPEHVPHHLAYLDLWCLEEVEDETHGSIRYRLGYRIEPCIEEVEEFFTKHLNKEITFSASINSLLEDFYLELEDCCFPEKRMHVRDFAYHPSNPLHFGRKNSPASPGSPSLEQYSAKVLYDYETSMEGELGVKSGDLIQVISDLRNGWVIAKRSDDIGMVPENYIQRIDLNDA